MWLVVTITAFHKEDDYAKKPARLNSRFLRCATLRVAPVEMTGPGRCCESLRSKLRRSSGTYEMRYYSFGFKQERKRPLWHGSRYSFIYFL